MFGLLEIAQVVHVVHVVQSHHTEVRWPTGRELCNIVRPATDTWPGQNLPLARWQVPWLWLPVLCAVVNSCCHLTSTCSTAGASQCIAHCAAQQVCPFIMAAYAMSDEQWPG